MKARANGDPKVLSAREKWIMGLGLSGGASAGLTIGGLFALAVSIPMAAFLVILGLAALLVFVILDEERAP